MREGELLRQCSVKGVGLAGGAEQDVLRCDELRIFRNEDLARITEVKLLGVVTEEFAVYAAPHQTAVSVDVDLGDAELGCAGELASVNAGCTLDVATGWVMRSTSSFGTEEERA